jgi:RNA polymerase sigma-70 factor (ECF subfamily)
MAANDPGRRARYEALFAAHYRDVHRYALRRTDAVLAEEVANEAFLVAGRRLDRIPPEHPLPWLYAAAAHVLANQRRTATRHARRSEAAAAERRPAGRDPADRLAERDAVLGAFATLAERDREALRLTAWERLSLADGARGWKDDEGSKGFAENLQTVVERFRARYRGLRDAGDTTFNGRPARAFTSGDETYYVDRDTAMPLGSVLTPKAYRVKIDPTTRKPVPGARLPDMRIVETVDRFERLPATPENLKLLDAPAIDAAQR